MMKAVNEHALARDQGANSKHNPPRLQRHSTLPLETLLTRLANVRQFNQGYRATCPAHGSDRNQSLSIAVADDQRVLIHCFAGCPALDILHSVGLELKDLYPERIPDRTPQGRKAAKEFRCIAGWQAALETLELEARIIVLAGHHVHDGIGLDQDDMRRVDTAIARIESARLVLNG